VNIVRSEGSFRLSREPVGGSIIGSLKSQRKVNENPSGMTLHFGEETSPSGSLMRENWEGRKAYLSGLRAWCPVGEKWPLEGVVGGGEKKNFGGKDPGRGWRSHFCTGFPIYITKTTKKKPRK